MMKRTTERKWHSWLNGVAQTTCPSMWRRQKRLWWTSGETPLTTPPLNIDSSTVERVSSTKFLGVHITEDLTHQHQVCLQEGTAAPTLSPPAEKSKPPSTHPHHLLQGYRWERADQLHHCLVRELLCSRPQDPPADSEHRCKNHWCPSPLHPGYFSYTMLQQSKKYREGPHPSLPQSLPAPTLR